MAPVQIGDKLNNRTSAKLSCVVLLSMRRFEWLGFPISMN
jgi:hypothetical protein